MNLCHTITLTKAFTFVHEIQDRHAILSLPTSQVLMPPKNIGASRWLFAALRKGDVDLGDNVPIVADVVLAIELAIVDDFEQRPFFSSHSGARSLFILGELIDGLFDGASVLGLTKLKITTNPLKNNLQFTCALPAGISSHTGVGATMCLATICDALFFERGLKIASSQIDMEYRNSELPKHFLNYLKSVFVSLLNDKV